MSDYPQNSAQRLYEGLPEIYRNKDEAANGDLKNYLGSLGEVLDLTRHTLEQRYADSFPDAGQRKINAKTGSFLISRSCWPLIYNRHIRMDSGPRSLMLCAGPKEKVP